MPRARIRKSVLGSGLPGGVPGRREEFILRSARRMDQFTYDFSVDGATDFLSGRFLPVDAIVKSITVDVQTAVTGATDAVLKCGSQSLTASTDLTSLSGIATIALTDTDGIKITSLSELQIDFTAAPTAGKIRVFVEYFEGNE